MKKQINLGRAIVLSMVLAGMAVIPSVEARTTITQPVNYHLSSGSASQFVNITDTDIVMDHKNVAVSAEGIGENCQLNFINSTISLKAGGTGF